MAENIDETFAVVFKRLANANDDLDKGNYTEVKAYLKELHACLMILENEVREMRHSWQRTNSESHGKGDHVDLGLLTGLTFRCLLSII